MAAKSRRPAHRAVGLAVITLALLAVFGLSAPLRRSLRRASVDPDASALLSREINAALQHRQCPAVPQNGSALSVAFLHIPKTAGTSLVNAFKRFMPQDSPGRWCTRGGEDPDLPSVFSQCGREADGWVDPEPGHLKLLAATKRNFLTRCSGFSTHQDIRFFEQVGVDFSSTLTLVALRHPAERQISDYYYSMTARPQFMIDLHYAPKFDGDFRGLLKFAQEVGGDHQVRQLAGSFGCRWPGGPTTRPEGKKMLAVAKRNLERFCVVIIAVSGCLSGFAACTVTSPTNGLPANRQGIPQPASNRPCIALWHLRGQHVEMHCCCMLDRTLPWVGRASCVSMCH